MKALRFIIPLLLVIVIAGASCVFVTLQADGADNAPPVMVEQPQAYEDSAENADIGQVKDNLLAIDYLSEYDIESLSNKITSGDPGIDKQWALASLYISELWRVTANGNEVVVAILDTGIDGDHEDLAGQIIGEINFTDSPSADDVKGHGTHIAGIIAAEDNGIGIIGISPGTQLLNVKVANDRGRCDVSNLAEGIVWAVDNGADVINISIEIRESTPELEEAVQYAWEKGALIIAAAGNSGTQEPVYPAYYDTSISVGAVKEDNSLVPLSNWGDWVDLVAPGYKIYSTFPGDTYEYESGTSFAAAHISGIAALLFGVVDDANGDGRINDDVKAIIEAGCKDIGIAGTGQGIIDAVAISAIIG